MANRFLKTVEFVPIRAPLEYLWNPFNNFLLEKLHESFHEYLETCFWQNWFYSNKFSDGNFPKISSFLTLYFHWLNRFLLTLLHVVWRSNVLTRWQFSRSYIWIYLKWAIKCLLSLIPGTFLLLSFCLCLTQQLIKLYGIKQYHIKMNRYWIKVGLKLTLF